MLSLYRIPSVFRSNKPVPERVGYVNVFPNYRHVHRSDGLGMPSLSPMRLGPVLHGEPGLPAAQNIENYFQFAKVFPDEVDATTGLPTAAWLQALDKAYRDEVPHRHKRKRVKPVFAARKACDGSIRTYDYIESRLFYCMAYEKLARQSPDFARLCALFDDEHKSLRICGFDAYDMGDDADADVLYQHYTDPAKPFGHERVLYAMLRLRHENQDLLPWRRYLAENPHVYQDATFMQ
jgi:hypothetical protein